MFEDINGAIRNCKSKMDRQYNGQKEKGKKGKQWPTMKAVICNSVQAA